LEDVVKALYEGIIIAHDNKENITEFPGSASQKVLDVSTE